MEHIRTHHGSYHKTKYCDHSDAVTPDNFADYKKKVTKIAKQLHYRQSFIDRIVDATNVTQIQQIMIAARHAFFGDDGTPCMVRG